MASKYNPSRRTSLPAVFHGTGANAVRSPKSLSPKLGFLKEISEFEIDPPFLSPASSSSSADNSPMLLSPAGRPASARLYRRQRKFSSNCADQAEWVDVDDFCTPQRTLIHRRGTHHNIGGDLAVSSLTPPSSRCSANSPALSSSVSPPFTDRPLMENGPLINNRRFSPRMTAAESLEEEPAEDDSPTVDLDVVNLRNALQARANRMTKYQQMRSFNIDAQGRIVDCGFRNTGGKLFKPPARSNKNRRATCPEIWLSSADEDVSREVIKCVLRLYGSPTVGKKSVTKQLVASAEVVPNADAVSIASDDLQRPGKTVSFLVNDNEIEMEITQGSGTEVLQIDPFQSTLTIYVVIYSVDNRDSFAKAAQTLYRLYDRRMKSAIPLLLVANKVDLQRKRRVSSIEGKMLAKIYKCPFVEISATLSMNVDSLWRETLRKIQKHKLARDQALEKGVVDLAGSSQVERRRNSRLVGRIMDRTRRFAKSCEELVARIAAM